MWTVCLNAMTQCHTLIMCIGKNAEVHLEFQRPIAYLGMINKGRRTNIHLKAFECVV